MWKDVISKNVGSSYEIVCDKPKHTVTIYHQGKKKKSYEFPKMFLAVNFYAALKLVKQMKELDTIYQKTLYQ